jgi:hypothetical protein
MFPEAAPFKPRWKWSTTSIRARNCPNRPLERPAAPARRPPWRIHQHKALMDRRIFSASSLRTSGSARKTTLWWTGRLNFQPRIRPSVENPDAVTPASPRRSGRPPMQVQTRTKRAGPDLERPPAPCRRNDPRDSVEIVTEQPAHIVHPRRPLPFPYEAAINFRA